LTIHLKTELENDSKQLTPTITGMVWRARRPLLPSGWGGDWTNASVEADSKRAV